MKVIKTCNSFPVTLFVTGTGIEEACQYFCDVNGLCVTITETNYVFTNGNERGFIIGLINYPRFPKERWEIELMAEALGRFLINRCNPNGSFTLQTPKRAVFFSNRDGD